MAATDASVPPVAAALPPLEAASATAASPPAATSSADGGGAAGGSGDGSGAGAASTPFTPITIRGGVDGEYSVVYSMYKGEHQLEPMMALFDSVLSEPYSIFTYRYFLHQWPELCFLAHIDDRLVGAIVCKSELRKQTKARQGYVAMLAVDTTLRRSGIGTQLATLALNKMAETCDEVMLETEETNSAALKLYQNLGFTRTKRLNKYYLNGVDAFRLKIWFS